MFYLVVFVKIIKMINEELEALLKDCKMGEIVEVTRKKNSDLAYFGEYEIKNESHTDYGDYQNKKLLLFTRRFDENYPASEGWAMGGGFYVRSYDDGKFSDHPSCSIRLFLQNQTSVFLENNVPRPDLIPDEIIRFRRIEKGGVWEK